MGGSMGGLTVARLGPRRKLGGLHGDLAAREVADLWEHNRGVRGECKSLGTGQGALGFERCGSLLICDSTWVLRGKRRGQSGESGVPLCVKHGQFGELRGRDSIPDERKDRLVEACEHGNGEAVSVAIVAADGAGRIRAGRAAHSGKS